VPRFRTNFSWSLLSIAPGRTARVRAIAAVDLAQRHKIIHGHSFSLAVRTEGGAEVGAGGVDDWHGMALGQNQAICAGIAAAPVASASCDTSAWRLDAHPRLLTSPQLLAGLGARPI